MKQYKIIYLPLLFWGLFPLITNGQASSQPKDPTVENFIEERLEKIQKSPSADSLKRIYAEEFFNYYKDHPENQTAQKALPLAFKMWGELGAANKVLTAMGQLDDGSIIWSRFIPYIEFAFIYSDHKTHSDYIILLEELRDQLTHPESKSQVLWNLSLYYHDQKETKELQKVAQEMINLDADEFYVDKGMGYLREIESLSIGEIAPPFTAKNIDGNPIYLSEFKDKVIILEFWATWCGPCLPEIPHLKALNATYDTKDLQIIGISLDRNTENLKEFIKNKRIEWPQIQQPKTWEDVIPDLYNVNGIPRTYIINRNGEIAAKDLRGEELEQKVAELIKMEK